VLNRILQQQHGHKIAVIENEFSQENIDNEILVQDSSEQIIEMNNYCICCMMRMQVYGPAHVALQNVLFFMDDTDNKMVSQCVHKNMCSDVGSK